MVAGNVPDREEANDGQTGHFCSVSRSRAVGVVLIALSLVI